MAKKKVVKKKAAKKDVNKCSCKESLIVASKVKAYVRSKGMMSSSEMLGSLSCKIYCMLDAAIERTTANRRSTVKPQDL
ncbi:MAG: hypothetical protein ABIG61_11790 [Planctomycetota bacterium]